MNKKLHQKIALDLMTTMTVFSLKAQDYNFQLVKDINPGNAHRNPQELTIVLNQLFFLANLE